MDKLRIAIFDLTDCEGCELQFLGLKEKLLKFAQDYEIANWRLVQPHQGDLPDVDVAIIQGTVITAADVDQVKKVRDKSKFLVAIGECARTGWIPAWIKKENRANAVKYVYGENYHPKAIGAFPVKNIVKVDLEIPGCPPEPALLEKFLNDIPNLKTEKGSKKTEIGLENGK
ncbi:MAG: sulfhydrogenase 1 subunit delta [Candidatus Berkelbacteria bacterium]|nr:sulfhydrogenase 1 subunit delta [Candidatus Berkelbacteria bacterium]